MHINFCCDIYVGKLSIKILQLQQNSKQDSVLDELHVLSQRA